MGGAYHRRLARVYAFLTTPGQRILEIGCGEGDLLAACRPSFGVGIDFTASMITRARRRHPQHHFAVADGQEIPVRAAFDSFLLSDLLNDVWDVQTVLAEVKRVASPHSRILLNFYSRLWEMPLTVAEKLGLAKPVLRQNWLTVDDVRNLLALEGLRVVRSWQEFIFPFDLPIVGPILNRFVARFWPFRHLGMANFVVAAAEPPRSPGASVSVIVPARNEAGNIRPLLEQLPAISPQPEVIFVEGHSREGTFETIRRELEARPGQPIRLLRQSGEGKGDAVRAGFDAATGEILVILDADLSVRPSDLPRFIEALRQGRAEFVNGVRLVYPMEGQAMRFLNLIGNKLFSYLFSWLLGQPVKDTLCGTKAMWREDYRRLSAGRAYFGEFDPFGDFDLLFGAAKLGLTLVDLPVRYQRRSYGTTNIHRWRHGWLLLKMAAFAAARMKFI